MRLFLCFSYIILLKTFSISADRKSSILRDWPSHIALPMMLMRENMQKSMFQSVNSTANSPGPGANCTRARASNRASGGGGGSTNGFACPVCGRIYKLRSSLRNHVKWECGKEPQFQCPYCDYKAKQKMHMLRHMERMHREIDYSSLFNGIVARTKDEGAVKAKKTLTKQD